MLKVFIPDVPPKRLRPLLVGRDYNDQRRVVILGSDPAVISCVETLRQFEYTVSEAITQGEIIVISDKEDLPIDKTLLRRNVRYLDHDKLELRD